MKKLQILLFILSAGISTAKAERLKILASNNAVAGLVQMVVGQEFDVLAVNINSGCSAHYHAKPSDKVKLDFSNLAVIIDDKFEIFFYKMLKNYQGKVIKISNFSTVDFKEGVNRTNWHFWLNIENDKIVVQELAKQIKILYPDFSKAIDQNVKIALKDLDKLERYRNQIITSLNIPIIISASTEHLFDNDEDTVFMLKTNNPSLNYAQKLQEELVNNSEHCLVIDSNEKIDQYLKYSHNIAQLNVDNWQREAGENFHQMFIRQYQSMLGQLSNCSAAHLVK